MEETKGRSRGLLFAAATILLMACPASADHKDTIPRLARCKIVVPLR
jgi:hypothetical protein